MPSGAFDLVDIGQTGRRALVLVFDAGLDVLATDAVAAECALRAGLIALRRLGAHDAADRLAPSVPAIVAAFPSVPDDECRTHEQTSGAVEDWTAMAGFAYVRPMAESHEFGGMFVAADGRPLSIGPARVHLVSGSADAGGRGQ